MLRKLAITEINRSLNVKLPAGGMNFVKLVKEKRDIFFHDENLSA